eukprot:COSAG01_NODE_3775_length_5710_cov_6.461059_4_plen_123_part_00
MPICSRSSNLLRVNSRHVRPSSKGKAVQKSAPLLIAAPLSLITSASWWSLPSPSGLACHETSIHNIHYIMRTELRDIDGFGRGCGRRGAPTCFWLSPRAWLTHVSTIASTRALDVSRLFGAR